jgi:hypothetical protein
MPELSTEAAMNPLPYLLAPLLLVPAASFPLDDAPVPGQSMEVALAEQPVASAEPTFEPAMPFSRLVDMMRGKAEQVSIEQRIIIRIAPRAPVVPDSRINLMADLPRNAAPRFKEKSMQKCVPASGIAGVQIAPENHLVLFMRDSRLVSTQLEKSCNARDFYSGFYVQRSGDGMICSGRDKLQSRNGASCKLGKLKQLVEKDD